MNKKTENIKQQASRDRLWIIGLGFIFKFKLEIKCNTLESKYNTRNMSLLLPGSVQ